METKEFTVEELKTVITETVKESDLAKGLDEVKKTVDGLKASKATTKEERAEVSKQFIKDLVEGKTITTNTNSFGYTVPTELADAVHEKKDKISKIRSNAFVFKMSGKFDIPTEGTGVTAYWITTEADGDLTESNPTTGKSSLDDYYLASRVRVPYKLLDTSGINVEAYVSNLASRALVRQEETAFVAGTGSSQPTGLRSATITSYDQAGATLAYDDLVGLYYSVPEQYRAGASWLTSPLGMKAIRKIKDTYGMPIFDVEKSTLFGRPLLETVDVPENLGTTTNETEIYLGDLKEYWIKDGQSMLAEKRAVPGRLQVDLYLYEAVDGVLMNNDAFRKLQMVK